MRVFEMNILVGGSSKSVEEFVSFDFFVNNYEMQVLWQERLDYQTLNLRVNLIEILTFVQNTRTFFVMCEVSSTCVLEIRAC